MKNYIEKDKIAYSIKEACKATGLSAATIHKLFNQGRLKRRKVGKRTFILAADIVQFFHSCGTENSNEVSTESSSEKKAPAPSSATREAS